MNHNGGQETQVRAPRKDEVADCIIVGASVDVWGWECNPKARYARAQSARLHQSAGQAREAPPPCPPPCSPPSPLPALRCTTSRTHSTHPRAATLSPLRRRRPCRPECSASAGARAAALPCV